MKGSFKDPTFGLKKTTTKLFYKAIEKLEQCSEDGIDCDHCAVRNECIRCWYGYVSKETGESYRNFLTKFSELRKTKGEKA